MREIVLEKDKFAVLEDGREVGMIACIPHGEETLIADYIFVDEELRGTGLSEQLVKQLVQHARETNKKVVPSCPYVYAQFRRNKDYHDVWKQ